MSEPTPVVAASEYVTAAWSTYEQMREARDQALGRADVAEREAECAQTALTEACREADEEAEAHRAEIERLRSGIFDAELRLWRLADLTADYGPEGMRTRLIAERQKLAALGTPIERQGTETPQPAHNCEQLGVSVCGYDECEVGRQG